MAARLEEKPGTVLPADAAAGLVPMRCGRMTAFHLLLIAVWAVVAAVTVWALAELGLPAALPTFFGDLQHPWRAQFYADLEAHLLLVGAWMIYRERSRAVGIACAVLTLLLGALFSLPYVLLASVRAHGDARVLLLGSRGRQ
jgi:RsiW-degrading membrane proteinase PrsW (M82 family)